MLKHERSNSLISGAVLVTKQIPQSESCDKSAGHVVILYLLVVLCLEYFLQPLVTSAVTLLRVKNRMSFKELALTADIFVQISQHMEFNAL